MKKRVLVIVLLLTLAVFTGCTKKDKTKSTLMKVLSENSKFVYNNNEQTLTDYINNDPYKIDTKAYAMVDMNEDSKKELVLYLEGIDAEYLVLSLEDDKIFAYKYSIKDFQDLRENGVYKRFINDKSYAYMRSSYNKGTLEEKSLATIDNDKYTVNNETSSKESFDEYENKLNESNKVKYTKYN